MQFLRNQSELKTLKIALTREEPLTNVDLSEILSVCPTLVNFCLKNSTHTSYGYLEALQVVSTSKLGCFMSSVEHFSDFNDSYSSTSFNLHANNTLQTLKLGTPVSVSISEDRCLQIMKQFCNLRHLEINVPSDAVLQAIFQYHVSFHFAFP